MKKQIKNTIVLTLFTLFSLTLAQAEEIMINDIIAELPIEGNISFIGEGNISEIDTYTFTANKKGKYIFYSTYTADRLDIRSEFYEDNGTRIADNDDGNSYLNFAYSVYLKVGETYHMKVRSYSTSDTGTYSLHVLLTEGVNSPVKNNEILENFPTSGNISSTEEVNTFSFTPMYSGEYTLFSEGSLDVVATLYDSNHTELISDDDNGTSYNFKFAYYLDANETYTLDVKSFASKYLGSYYLNYTHSIDFQNNNLSSITPHDFNGDGIADILWRKDATNHVWLMNKNGSRTYINIGGKSSEYNITGTGDFNGDGITDILWRKGFGNYIWYMNADATHRYQKIASKSYVPQSIADFNNDGISDILWRKDQKNHIWYMQADGNHTYMNIGGRSSEYNISGTGDFNGDGTIDILWRKGFGNYIWYMNADGTHVYKKIGSKSRDFVGIGDFNGDGIADILWDGGHAWHMNIDTSHYYTKLNYFSPRSIKIADFNGDGISDIFYKEYGRSTRYINYIELREMRRETIGPKNSVYQAY